MVNFVKLVLQIRLLCLLALLNATLANVVLKVHHLQPVVRAVPVNSHQVEVHVKIVHKAQSQHFLVPALVRFVLLEQLHQWLVQPVALYVQLVHSPPMELVAWIAHQVL